MEDESKGFWGLVKDFFNSISLKVKLFFGAVVGIAGFIAINSFRKKLNDKKILELELERVRAEIDIEKAQEDIDINNEKINHLNQKAEQIVAEIAELEEKREEQAEMRKEEKISNEELDDFFDKRGF
jgi:uncharacterized membrane-anchored protein YhcB (DUF1043 family)|tara:strand:+ start:3861 stop:4241 length:381 start_codon:yes stop_codon:yes gene_type:complete